MSVSGSDSDSDSDFDFDSGWIGSPVTASMQKALKIPAPRRLAHQT
ncbi:hypothetical protein [Streptomyces xantholiticus]|uniref:Uncharacterized protein n=1 Tax=Streptomyces xantholiticus TaxID=68285 RepID=A0ABV1UZQ9_9ACTN